jgi:hypothetical protein
MRSDNEDFSGFALETKFKVIPVGFCGSGHETLVISSGFDLKSFFRSIQ